MLILLNLVFQVKMDLPLETIVNPTLPVALTIDALLPRPVRTQRPPHAAHLLLELLLEMDVLQILTVA